MLADKLIESAEGVQQGDPLGPLLFSLAIHEMLQGANCEFVLGYLDDVALGDRVQQVIEALKILETKAKSIGL